MPGIACRHLSSQRSTTPGFRACSTGATTGQATRRCGLFCLMPADTSAFMVWTTRGPGATGSSPTSSTASVEVDGFHGQTVLQQILQSNAQIVRFESLRRCDDFVCRPPAMIERPALLLLVEARGVDGRSTRSARGRSARCAGDRCVRQIMWRWRFQTQRGVPVTIRPVSSRASRTAASAKSSPGSTMPPIMIQNGSSWRSSGS